MFDSYVPCMPSMPVNCGSVPGNAPRPISVFVHGKPSRRTRRVNCGAALLRITPPPAYTIGRFASSSSCTAFLIWPAWPLVTGLYERSDTVFG